MTVIERVYHVLIAREFRAGPRPGAHVREHACRMIAARIASSEPVALLHFWGGCKNPNLPHYAADECEELSLQHLHDLHQAVSRVYGPGLVFHILLGDERVRRANGAPEERLQAYAASLEAIAARFNGRFNIVRVSTLIRRRAAAFRTCFENAERTYSATLLGQPDFDTLATNARKNLFISPETGESRLRDLSVEAARQYVLCRIAEEEAGLFRDYAGCLRSSFIRYTQFYQRYIDVERTDPRLDAGLVFFTGGKGNVTQPWQAVAHRAGGRVSFLTQKRLREAALPPLPEPTTGARAGSIHGGLVP